MLSGSGRLNAEDVIDAGDGEGVAADGGDELTRPDGEGLGTVLAGAVERGYGDGAWHLMDAGDRLWHGRLRYVRAV